VVFGVGAKPQTEALESSDFLLGAWFANQLPYEKLHFAVHAFHLNIPRISPSAFDGWIQKAI
jgi:hypothetical protein